MKIGILALQGAFIEHSKILSSLGVDHFEIRQKQDLQQNFEGLILPGGESTVMCKLLHELELFAPLQEKIQNGLPVFGTCAGLILLAKNIANDSLSNFATMNIVTVRNAYGRQLGSFRTQAEFKGVGSVPMTFIRAPYIDKVSENCEILATVDGKIVAAQEKNQLVTAFHPELDNDPGVHRYFLSMI